MSPRSHKGSECSSKARLVGSTQIREKTPGRNQAEGWGKEERGHLVKFTCQELLHPGNPWAELSILLPPEFVSVWCHTGKRHLWVSLGG